MLQQAPGSGSLGRPVGSCRDGTGNAGRLRTWTPLAEDMESAIDRSGQAVIAVGLGAMGAP